MQVGLEEAEESDRFAAHEEPDRKADAAILDIAALECLPVEFRLAAVDKGALGRPVVAEEMHCSRRREKSRRRGAAERIVRRKEFGKEHDDIEGSEEAEG